MMSKPNQSQSVLARLLAKENIKIQHGNYSTAFFDVKNRILGLPNWKDTSKDVYDLLCGHEVGHALYTPSNAFDSELTVRKDLLNVVEDVRIERMIQETYPGLIRCFQSAYSQLKDKNFFGINGRDVNTLGFADRINLKAKLGDLIDIKFSSAEEVIRQKIHAAQTWQEVLEATASLEKYLGEAAQKSKPEPTVPESGESPEQSPTQSQQPGQSADESAGKPDDKSSEQGDSAATDDSEEASKNDNDSGGLGSDAADKDAADSKPSDDSSNKPAAEQDGKSDQKLDQKADTNGEKTEQLKNAEPTTPDSPVVETQTAFDANSKNLLDTSKDTLATVFAQAPTDHELDEVITPYGMIAANRLTNSCFVAASNSAENLQSFSAFMKQTRKAVGLLIKEFELRKAAYQYSRATVAKTGSLNVERLHAYKVSDDLFLSVTKLANSKNHAMMMFVDYSGSMQRVLPHVLKHLINLSVFCRNLGIPFRVYGFTSDNGFTTPDRTPYSMSPEQAGYDRVLISNLNLIELVSSELSKTQFNDAIYALWLRSKNEAFAGKAERLGNTPLNETLIVAHKLVSQFKAKYNPDRMIAIFLTDGDGQALRTVSGDVMNSNRVQLPGYPYCNQIGLDFKLNGRYVRSKHWDYTTNALIENLRITTNSEVIGFFIPQRNCWVQNKAVAAIESGNRISHSAAWALWKAKFEKEYKDNDMLAIAGAYGYSNYFVVASGEDLSIGEDEDIEITEDMSRSRMAKVFTEYSKSKRSNRVFVTKFAEALA